MTRTKKIATLFVVVAAILIGGGFLVERLLQVDTYKQQIIAALEKELHREVRYETGKFTLRYGPAFSFTDVQIRQREGSAPLLTADKLTFRISLLPLLEKKVVLRRLLLDRPQLLLVREKNGTWNVDDLLQAKQESSPLQVTGIRVRNGTLRVIDRMMSPARDITLSELQLSLSHLARGDNCRLKISSLLAEGETAAGNIAVTGSVRIPAADHPMKDAIVDTRIIARDIPADTLWPYYRQYVPFKKVLGLVSIDSNFEGRLANFTSKGQVHIRNVTFDYPQVFHAVLTPKDITAQYDLELTPDDISIKTIDLSVDDFRVKGSCVLGDIRSGDLRITAHASTAPFRLETYHPYIPYGIIVEDTADFIEQHIKGGVYRLDEGRLDGRVSQIAHMERGENYNVLYIRGKVEKGIVSFGAAVPTFNNIAGELEMKGKDFNLNGMSGNFGTSPFTLNGKITDYPLDKPSGYPFSMNMSPRQPEAAWLFDRQKTGKLSLSGPSTLKLSGEGYTSGYNLSGDWDLTPASFSYPGIVTKPAGRQSHFLFKGSINDHEARVDSLTASLGGMNATASAKYRFDEKQRLSFEVRTNRFAAAEIAQLLPKAAQYKPSGTMQAYVSATSKQNDVKDLHWSGTVSFADASFKLADAISPLSNVTGTLNFNGDSLQTSYMTVRLGTSVISGKGSLVGFNNPEFNIDFTSPKLSLADVGLKAPDGELKLSRLAGNVSLKNNNLHIRSFSGTINDSSLSVSGTISNLRNPRADLAVHASHLDIEDIMALAEVEPVKPQEGPPLRLALHATVSVDSVRAAGFAGEKLKATVSYEDRILYLQPLDCLLYGGRANARGRFDFTTKNNPRHQVSYEVHGVSTERTLKALGVAKQEVSGTLSLSGDLTAKGATSADIRKTALGSVHLRIKDGSIRRFPVLSKVFSILNVSQLLKGQLPDMVSGGMPFNSISATLAVREGVVSTQDLFIDSNAINVSAVGKLDMIRNDIDLTIGAQPLQTVDKVVNRLPIVGWILTGDNNAFLTTYFEAKGKLDDPSVKAVPVKSMGKGALNIFKRVFQLPAKLFTETGEVMLGQ